MHVLVFCFHLYSFCNALVIKKYIYLFLNGFNFILNSVFRLIFTFMSFIFISDTGIDFNLVFFCFCFYF